MIQVQREVRTGATRFWVSARAASIEGTVSVAGARNPGGEVRLVSAGGVSGVLCRGWPR